MRSSASLVVASDASVSEKSRARTGEALQLARVATEDAGTDTEPLLEPAAPTAALENAFLRTAMIWEEAAEAGVFNSGVDAADLVASLLQAVQEGMECGGDGECCP